MAKKVMLESSTFAFKSFDKIALILLTLCGAEVWARGKITLKKSPKNAIKDRQIIQDKLTVVPIWSVISKASLGPFLK